MTLMQLRYVIEVSQAASMNEAAKRLFISQPTLSTAIKDLEEELGVDLFMRSSRGIQVTPEGKEFLGYAKQVVEQYELIESRYVNKTNVKKKFSVSMQHYTFAVHAFVDLVKQFGMDDYDFAVYETRTWDVIENVKNHKSEVGVLYLNDFNRQVLTKMFKDRDLTFTPVFDCHVYAYLWKEHPLADRECVTLEELSDYPCLAFDQGDNNSFYFAEELFSTHEYKKIIHASDRATLLNLFVGMNGYTLCCGIICEDLNGSDYRAVRLDTDELMTIGYLKRKGTPLSELGQLYVEEMAKYKDQVMQ